LAGIAWMLRTDPVGPISGRRLSGDEVSYPADWSFTDDHFTIAVESRPNDPHSVTTICFVHDGDLYVPAQGGDGKRWTHYVEDDPRVRLKVGRDVYRARAVRVTDAAPEKFTASAARKYSQIAEREGPPPDDIWLFRIEPPEG
jgi:hypothetical protein